MLLFYIEVHSYDIIICLEVIPLAKMAHAKILFQCAACSLPIWIGNKQTCQTINQASHHNNSQTNATVVPHLE